MKTLRARLTLWYITSTVVVFVLLASLFSFLLWVTLHNQIDHHIHIVTGQAQQIVEDFDGAERQKLLTNLVSFEGMSIVMVSNDGRELLQTNSKDVRRLEAADLAQLLTTAATYGHHPRHFTIKDMRFGIADVEVEGKPALLAVGNSVNILRQTFYRMMVITLGVMLVTLLPFTLIGHRLLKKYLYPLEVIANTAQQVTHPKQLSTRVTGLTLSEELKVIVSSFNTMLSQLEKVFQTEHEFFSQAAHTLKTPLAVLRAKIEGSNKESQANKQDMLKTIDTAVDTIQDLLLISRIETGNEGEVHTLNLSNIADELVELAKVLAGEKDIRVTHEIEKEIFIKADIRLLKRALGNLVDNAINYANESGLVEISLKGRNTQAVFTVENSGGVINKEEVPHLFDRFYRGKNVREGQKGSGLGLAISKVIIESVKGKISIVITSQKTIKVVVAIPLS